MLRCLETSKHNGGKQARRRITAKLKVKSFRLITNPNSQFFKRIFHFFSKIDRQTFYTQITTTRFLWQYPDDNEPRQILFFSPPDKPYPWLSLSWNHN